MISRAARVAMTGTAGALAVGAVWAISSCAGPQPLDVAIRPADETAYVAAVNATHMDGRQAFANWMARERGRSPDAILKADSAVSTTRNPFDANKDARAVSRGAVIFKVHCAKCHGEDARGKGPSVLPDHPAKDFHAFGKRFAVTLHRGAPRSWFRKISNGQGDEVTYEDGPSRAMPAFGDKLTREQRWLAITYLQSLDVYAADRAAGD